MKRRAVLLLLAVVLAACGRVLPVQPPVAEPAPRVEYGASIYLAPGQGVTVGDVDPLLITFDRVIGDSRCPPDVQCVWQGEVTVQLRLSTAGADTVVALSTVREPRQVEYRGRVVAVREVTPPPRSGGVDPQAYRVRLEVRESGGGH